MNILFIDDTERVRKRYVGVGGVILHDDYIDNLYTNFHVIKKTYGIPPNEEIKWSPDKDSWIAKNLIEEERISAYSDILDLIRSFGGTEIVTVLQRDTLHYNLIEAKWKCIEFVTERFQFFLQAQEDKRGIIIADFPGSGKEEKKLLSDYCQFLDKGTDYVKPSNIIMNLLTTESHLNPGLQIADLVVGVTTAMCTRERDYALPLWPTVKKKLHRSRCGIVMGCGLKISPPETSDELHEILFPEDFEENYEEYRERMRYLYSQVMSEDELNINFP